MRHRFGVYCARRWSDTAAAFYLAMRRGRAVRWMWLALVGRLWLTLAQLVGERPGEPPWDGG